VELFAVLPSKQPTPKHPTDLALNFVGDENRQAGTLIGIKQDRGAVT
jgi:hypothetical protein